MYSLGLIKYADVIIIELRGSQPVPQAGFRYIPSIRQFKESMVESRN